MKMYDVKIALAGDGDVLITQECGIDETSTVRIHPDQVPIVCRWLMLAIGANTETREVNCLED